MYIDLTPDQKNLQSELSEYFEQLMDKFSYLSLDAGEGMGSSAKDIYRQLGTDGWLGVGWPKEYGGHGKGEVDQLIFLEAAAKAGCPLPMITLNTVGPTIAQWGTDEQKERFLPAILAGEIEVAIGYSEPDSGTDLASLKTRALRDGDEYVVNGQKIWTSGANNADFIWLAVRTDPDAPKHKGISLLMVDTTSPGFSWTPIWMLMGGHTNATYYNDVHVPVGMRVGEENGGWQMFTSQINRERVALGPSASLNRELDMVIEWARTAPVHGGGTVAEQQWVQMVFARMRAKIEAARLFNYRVAARAEKGDINPAEASTMKVYGTELALEVHRNLMEVTGAGSQLQKGTPGAVLNGKLESLYRGALASTFGGGTNEVQREIIAAAGLRTPRVPR